MKFSGPTLTEASFYIELDQFYCSPSAKKVCTWNVRPDNKSSVFKNDFQNFAVGLQTPHDIVCVNHDLARILDQEKYFHACTL